VLGTRGEWKSELQERVEQPVLRVFEPAPSFEVPGNGQVRNCAIVPACLAVGLWAIGRNEPVANVMLGIAAEPIPRLGRAERAPKITLGIKGLQRLLRGYVAEAMPACSGSSEMGEPSRPEVLT
jgi:hypothetical protein